MKKAIALVVFIFVVSAFSSSAQDRSYHFGLQVSPSISWIKPEVEGIEYKGAGSIIGVSYGAILENYFTPNVGILTGLNVLHNGGHLKYPYINTTLDGAGLPVLDSGSLERKYNLQYIEIPLMLIGSTGDVLGKFSFYGRFGISNGFRIKAKAEDQFTSDKTPEAPLAAVANINAKKDVSFFREALLIGIGAEYRIGNTAIAHMGLTFSNGFTDILKGNTNYNTAIKEKARSNSLELNIGIVF
jgi:hypothetical protein